MPYKNFKQKALSNPDVAREYIRLSKMRSLNYSIAQQVRQARIKAGFTQKRLAELVETHQTGIARLERGSFDENGNLPSLSFLFKIADALSLDILVSLPPKQSVKSIESYSGKQSQSSSPVSFIIGSQNPNTEAGFKSGLTKYEKPKIPN